MNDKCYDKSDNYSCGTGNSFRTQLDNGVTVGGGGYHSFGNKDGVDFQSNTLRVDAGKVFDPDLTLSGTARHSFGNYGGNQWNNTSLGASVEKKFDDGLSAYGGVQQDFRSSGMNSTTLNAGIAKELNPCTPDSRSCTSLSADVNRTYVNRGTDLFASEPATRVEAGVKSDCTIG